MSKTVDVTQEMVRELIDKANLGDKDALERLVYIFGPESTLDTATTFLEHGVELCAALVDDAGTVVNKATTVVNTGSDLFDSAMSAFDDIFG